LDALREEIRSNAEKKAVTCLVTVLYSVQALDDLYYVASHTDKGTEHEQFAHVVKLMLNQLSGICTLNAKDYSKRLLTKLNLQVAFMGMGTTSTRYSASGCMCNITPFVNVSSFVCEDVSDSVSLEEKLELRPKNST